MTLTRWFLNWAIKANRFCQFVTWVTTGNIEGSKRLNKVFQPTRWQTSLLIYFITLLKLVWRELKMVAMNNCKRKGVGLHRRWVGKRTAWFYSVRFTSLSLISTQRLSQQLTMEILLRYDKVLNEILWYIPTLHALNDKEICVDI